MKYRHREREEKRKREKKETENRDREREIKRVRKKEREKEKKREKRIFVESDRDFAIWLTVGAEFSSRGVTKQKRNETLFFGDRRRKQEVQDIFGLPENRDDPSTLFFRGHFFGTLLGEFKPGSAFRR